MCRNSVHDSAVSELLNIYVILQLKGVFKQMEMMEIFLTLKTMVTGRMKIKFNQATKPL